jgi:polyisoprenoid-binding protein YceI
MTPVTLLRSALGLALLLAGVCRAAPAIYELDPAYSFVHVEFLHFGTSTSRLRFGPVRGEVMLDQAAGRGELGLRIATASVDSGFRPFNSRLRQPDLLASDEFPEAFFVSQQFRFEGGQLREVRGEFTLRGVSQALVLQARQFGCRMQAVQPSPLPGAPAPEAERAPTAAPREVCGGEFEGELLRSDFGATFGLPLVGNRIRVLVQVEGLRR